MKLNTGEIKNKFIISIKKYLIETKRSKINISLSPLCFFTTWARTLGYVNMMRIRKMTRLNDLFFFFKNIILIGFDHDLQLEFNDKNIKKNKQSKRIIVTYCKKDHFDKYGNYSDNILHINSRNYSEYLWVLISIDNFKPQKIKNNIYIFRKKINKSFSIIYLLKKILCTIIHNKLSVRKIFHYLSQDYNKTQIIYKNFKKIFINEKIKSILINYEGIPYQNSIFRACKEIDKKIKTVGYLHPAPWPIQTDLFLKDNFIDLLIVSGKSQKNNLVKNFGWNKKKVINSTSVRFTKTNKNEFGGYFFVPYEIFKSKIYLEKFKYFIKNLPRRKYNRLAVRIHPLNKKSEKHIQFKNDIKNILSIYNNRFFNSKKKTTSIFLGPATGVMVQTLEEGNEVIHIPSDLIFDVFTSKIWKDIKSVQLAKGVYKYRLLKKNKLFNVNNLNNKFERYILPKI